MSDLVAEPVHVVDTSSSKHTAVNYLFAFVMLIIGLVFGYILVTLLPSSFHGPAPKQTKTEVTHEITLPRNAQRIQICSDHRGSLYVKPSDIPVGPVYMVYDGKVIGLEYMLAQDEFIAGKSYQYLNALGMKIDHVNTGLLAHGHAGYVKPHYHIDLYSVTEEFEKSITCGDNANEMRMDMPSIATPSSVISAPSGMKVSPTTGAKESMEMY